MAKDVALLLGFCVLFSTALGCAYYCGYYWRAPRAYLVGAIGVGFLSCCIIYIAYAAGFIV